MVNVNQVLYPNIGPLAKRREQAQSKRMLLLAAHQSHPDNQRKPDVGPDPGTASESQTRLRYIKAHEKPSAKAPPLHPKVESRQMNMLIARLGKADSRSTVLLADHMNTRRARGISSLLAGRNNVFEAQGIHCELAAFRRLAGRTNTRRGETYGMGLHARCKQAMGSIIGVRNSPKLQHQVNNQIRKHEGIFGYLRVSREEQTRSRRALHRMRRVGARKHAGRPYNMIDSERERRLRLRSYYGAASLLMAPPARSATISTFNRPNRASRGSKERRSICVSTANRNVAPSEHALKI